VESRVWRGWGPAGDGNLEPGRVLYAEERARRLGEDRGLTTWAKLFVPILSRIHGDGAADNAS
jgi:hypothetical protein